MITVLFFASIREQLATDRLSVTAAGTLSLSDLRAQIISEHSTLWAEVLTADNIVKAVNQQVVDDEHMINDGDEVAFFPPVTGG